MDETNNQISIEVASTRLERAMANLDTIVNQKSDQNKIISNLQNEIENLSMQNSKLSTDLNQSAKREKTLDKSASEVSKRLIDAMETIKSVLVK